MIEVAILTAALELTAPRPEVRIAPEDLVVLVVEVGEPCPEPIRLQAAAGRAAALKGGTEPGGVNPNPDGAMNPATAAAEWLHRIAPLP